MTTSYPQYGIYLIPPPALVYAVGVGHQLLKANFNAQTAGKFMVHCTLKGFFKLAEGASPIDFIPALDELFATTPVFETEFTELWNLPEGRFGASILIGMDRTEPFLKLHKAIWEIVRPYIAPDCYFSGIEPSGDKFPPHVTLAQSDLPTDPILFQQAVALCQHIFDSYLKGRWQAREIQLIEFYSEDWTGRWSESMRFKQLKGWQLLG
jgi:2'-5' RNA ligase